ncbi:iron-containing alcohol dehydrogenase [Aliiglaciecola sp. 3_MG-2023]|uniref:iron-containing alcohol dehydrogenase n=1 Tax=Aliiglaciecola sp. 3_MG-2023 TaxID=3062644 RepID=UPI0026E2B148|nr:iron-containing alcohol dehydrogenase [Aliiglaciecola sp. 3_MG-2023]MDO6694653.1 iron-containing alcohol dehydrogenase [Aliiglaciecola sp. 3_MG-2023]
MSFVFNTTKSIINAPNASSELGLYCQTLNIKNVLLVTDPGIVKLGLHQKMIASLENSAINYVLFSDVEVDPPTEVIENALAFAKNNNIDGVIGLGGGSSLDTAKLIAALTHSKQTLNDVFGIDKLENSRLPLIQIPTTAGTGSEVTPISIVTTGEAMKMGIVSSVLLPDIALLDATLTVKLPPHITAATGIDAMVHAIEAYTSKIKKNIYSDMLAVQALKLMANNIQTAVHQGEDLTARSNMMLGATLAGQAFANAPVAAVHALAYPLGGHYHIPHGLSNSLVLPHVLKFNMSSAAHLYAELADVIIPEDCANLGSDNEKAQAFIQHLEYLIADIGLPNRLASVEVNEDALPMLAKDAMKQERLLINNPRPMNEADILAIYQAAY